jgi:glycosyltransferase involved in cell wall biosynthesis
MARRLSATTGSHQEETTAMNREMLPHRQPRTGDRTLLYVIGVVPDKMGCVELFAREAARELHRRGWKVVFCFEAPPSPRVCAELDLPNVTLETISDQTETGIHQAAQFFRLVAEHRPAIVIYAFNSVFKPYAWIARSLGVRRVFFNDHTSRWDADLVQRPPVTRLVGRALMAPIDGVICVSRFVQSCVRQRGFVEPGRVHVVYNGVDLHASDDAAAQARAFRARHGIADDRRLVLQVSWMTRRKGIDNLLHAAARVVAEVPEALFVLVGDGDERGAYQRLAVELGIADHVLWTGVVEQPTAEGVFAAAAVCCQASQWHEAFGATIAEAMSFSVPVVATRVGGIPELVREGETGFLVDRDDVPALAARIVELLRDDALRARLGREGRRVAEEAFDLSRTVARYLEIVGIEAQPSGARSSKGRQPSRPSLWTLSEDPAVAP